MMSVAAQHFRKLGGLPADWSVDVGLVLGSGLGGAADNLLDSKSAVVSFRDLPGMVTPGVAGHVGRFIVGQLGRLKVIIQQGRVHLYEGVGESAVIFPAVLMSELGVRVLVVTNAVGGIRRDLTPGDLMLIRDSIRVPVVASDGNCGTLSDSSVQHVHGHRIWCPRLLQIFQSLPVAKDCPAGTYAMMPGPAYETPAEVKMLRFLGADAVGMSAIPEAMAVSSRGGAVLGISCVTNVAAGIGETPLDHTEVTETGQAAENKLRLLIAAFLEKLSHELEDSGRVHGYDADCL